jgi:hypothetical protein
MHTHEAKITYGVRYPGEHNIEVRQRRTIRWADQLFTAVRPDDVYIAKLGVDFTHRQYSLRRRIIDRN